MSHIAVVSMLFIGHSWIGSRAADSETVPEKEQLCR